MIVTQLTGCIGDQLFQYAIARNFSLIYNCDLLVDSSWYVKNKKSKINPNKIGIGGFNTQFGLAGSVIINNFLRKKEPFYLVRYPETKNYKVIRENINDLTKDLYITNPPFLLVGEFKSETYFEENINQIIEDLSINISFLKKIQTLASEIVTPNSVAIYIRKNTVTKNKNILQNEIDFDYYQKAIDFFIKENILNDFIFFTDLEEEILQKLDTKGTFRIQKLFEDEFEWKNLFLMSKCKHFIADNSATSWWAAWLNFTNERTIVIPKYFKFDYPNITHNKINIQQNWIKL